MEYVKKIINTHHEFENNIIIDHFNTHSSETIIDSYITIKILSNSIIKRIRQFREIKSSILFSARNGDDINVFIPHTLGILSNYAYYVLAIKFKNIKLNIFYEGVIFFYNYNHNIKKNFSYYLSRWGVSLFSGIPYNINGKLLDLNNIRISKIYSPYLNIDAPTKKIIETKLDDIQYIPKNDTCVILAHGIDATFELQKKLVSAIFCKISEMNIDVIFLKDHPMEKCDMFYILAADMKIDIKVIESQLPIESIILQYAPKYIFSLWSSSIVNLKKTLPTEVEVFSIVSSEIIQRFKLEKLIQVFLQQEIRVIYV